MKYKISVYMSHSREKKLSVWYAQIYLILNLCTFYYIREMFITLE